MERFSFEIERQDVADALQAEAAMHGRTVEAELVALVEKTYAAKSPPGGASNEGNWVRDLIEIGRQLNLPEGLDPFIPPRIVEDYKPIKL